MRYMLNQDIDREAVERNFCIWRVNDDRFHITLRPNLDRNFTIFSITIEKSAQSTT